MQPIEEKDKQAIEAMSYDTAIATVEGIIKRLEEEQLPIDVILKESRKAAALISHCKNKISEVSEEVDAILNDLRGETKETEVDDGPF